jgi:hypothetical protein
LVRPGQPLDASSAFPRRDFSGNPVGDSFERYQAGAAIGGPLVRDKTFFYVNLEYTRDRNRNVLDAPALGTVTNVTGNNEFILGSLRLDHHLTDDWTVSLRANIGRVTIDRPGGSLGGGNVTFPSAGSDQDRNSSLVAASISYTGADWTYDGSLQLSSFRWDYGKPKNGAGPQVTVQDQTGLTVGVVGHPGSSSTILRKPGRPSSACSAALAAIGSALGAISFIPISACWVAAMSMAITGWNSLRPKFRHSMDAIWV